VERKKPYGKGRLVEALIQHAIRAEDQFWDALRADLSRPAMTHEEFNREYMCTVTGRIPQPFNPEPHRPPRYYRGTTLALTTGPGNTGLRWTNVVMVKSFVFEATVQIDHCGDAPFCPVRFITYDWSRP
jgi:hypothetical protein